jgi:hypothetical protein
VLRRPTSETTNSLSVSDESAPSLGISLAVAVGFSRHSGSRASLSRMTRRAACLGHPASLPTLGPLGQPEKAIGHESQIELWSPNGLPFCFAGFGTDRLRRQEAMKTAGRENPNHEVAWPRNRAHGAEEQNRSRSIKWAEKQDKIQPKEMCFFLTSTFIEPSGSLVAGLYFIGPEPLIRMSTSLLALSCQSGPDATLETPIRARSRSNGSRSLRMSPLFMAVFTSASIAPVT